VVAVGGGVVYDALGYSHHAVQDYSLMRTMPNMLLATPGAPYEVRACLRYLVANPGPSYLRIGKAGEPSFHNVVPDVAPGRWIPVATEGCDAAKVLLSTGAALASAIDRAERDPAYARQAVWSLPLWGMASKPFQPAQLASFDRVVTMEDHLIDGGFGSWMRESIAAQPDLAARLHTIALSADVCGTVGSQAMLHHLGGLSMR
jgi:transketolase